MSNSKSDVSTFTQHLVVNTYTDAMLSMYHTPKTSDETKRAIAVRCALELIHADQLSDKSLLLNHHMEALGSYADAIQNALKVEE